MGQPAKKLTKEQIGMVEGLAAVLSLEQMADYFSVAKNTFYAIMERQPEVSELYKRGRAKAIGSIANSLLTQARAGNLVAQMFYLKTQAHWREKGDTHESVSSASPVVVQFISKDCRADPNDDTAT